MNEITDMLNKIYWSELEKEGITKKDIGHVDLNIAFSPVTPFEGCDPCEVTQTIGGKYIVHSPLGLKTVEKEALQVMRYRYLQFDPERVKQREAVSALFGKFPKP